MANNGCGDDDGDNDDDAGNGNKVDHAELANFVREAIVMTDTTNLVERSSKSGSGKKKQPSSKRKADQLSPGPPPPPPPPPPSPLERPTISPSSHDENKPRAKKMKRELSAAARQVDCAADCVAAATTTTAAAAAAAAAAVVKKRSSNSEAAVVDAASLACHDDNDESVVLGNEYCDVEAGDVAKNTLVFEIRSEDGVHIVSTSIERAWRQLVERVSSLRRRLKHKALSYEGVSGATMYGLNNRSVVYLLEQFDSLDMCPAYTRKYAATDRNAPRHSVKWTPTLDVCARTARAYDPSSKKAYDPFYWLSSVHRSFSYLNLNKVFNQQFATAVKALNVADTCNAVKFRHLKEFSSNGLIVKCSDIQGRGLFTLVDIPQGQMIIEYAGEIIRHSLCDKRERYYDSRGIGCYMFRIDELEVIDATTKGNQARFINHSCDPNCISKVIAVLGRKHIVIFALRYIHKGEELTYDYKFPKEDVKIQCLCKSSRCRKYLN